MYIKYTFFLFFLFFVLGLQAQDSSNASGGEFTSVSGTVSFSVGQLVCDFYSGSSQSIAEGVHQPYEISKTFGIPILGADIELLVYPNPTFSTVILNSNKPDGLEYRLYTIHGKLIVSNSISLQHTEIDLSNLAQATYLLKVSKSGQIIKNFKLIKN